MSIETRTQWLIVELEKEMGASQLRNKNEKWSKMAGDRLVEETICIENGRGDYKI